jgi:hypothetical protein
MFVVVFYEPLNSLTNSIVNPKVKTMEEEGIGACSLPYNIVGVKGHVGTSG